ncbi:MAG: MFS transporter, partial [Planctomycetes bacterium]|nr:MFS transporter [Planctomycetota bacterium]
MGVAFIIVGATGMAVLPEERNPIGLLVFGAMGCAFGLLWFGVASAVVAIATHVKDPDRRARRVAFVSACMAFVMAFSIGYVFACRVEGVRGRFLVAALLALMVGALVAALLPRREKHLAKERAQIHLLLAEGWQEVRPAQTGRHLIWNDKQHLVMTDTSFSERKALGEIGGLNAPIAVDQTRKIAYCASVSYGCTEATEHSRRCAMGRGECCIAAFPLDSSAPRVVTKAPSGFEFNWLLHLLPGGDRLVSYLLSKEKPNDRALAIVDLSTGELTITALDPKLFFPHAIDTERQRIL